MALDITKLQPLARGNGFTFWHYDAGADAIATVDSSGYFNAGTAYLGAYNLMAAGDVILVKSGSGAAIGFVWVNSKSAGVLDTTDVLALTATDTD